jgi:hypothetical protein
VKAGKVPCQIIKVYSKDGSNIFTLPDLTANEKKDLVFLLKPMHKDLASSVSCNVVEVTLTYTDNEGSEAEKAVMLSVKFVKYEGPLAPQSATVFSHWYRVRGADYLREARELATQKQFRAAKEVLERGIQALQASGYIHCELVRQVLADMVSARDLVESDTTWERGGDQHFASISYSHFSQSASAFTPQYGTPQQSLQIWSGSSTTNSLRAALS